MRDDEEHAIARQWTIQFTIGTLAVLDIAVTHSPLSFAALNTYCFPLVSISNPQLRPAVPTDFTSLSEIVTSGGQ